MKLVRLVVWGVLAAILIILLILGLTGNLSSVFPNIDIPFNIGGSFSYPDSELYTVGPGSVDTGAVSDIYINWADGEVNVVEYSGNDIQFSESASYDLEPNEEMRYLVRNGKLTIQFCAPGKYSILNNIRGKSLTVYVPIGFEMDNFKVDSVSASVNVENVKAIKTVLDSVSGRIYAYGVYSDSIRLDTVSGKITVEECVVESVTSDTTSGVIELRGEFEEVKCDSVSGSIFVSRMRISRK